MNEYKEICEKRILGKFNSSSEYALLFEKIDALLLSGKIITVAIDGMCGSGKTFLSQVLTEKYDCNIFHADNFFLQKHQRTQERLSQIGGNLDFERLKSEVLDKIKLGKEFSYKNFSCSTLSLESETRVFPKQLNILEGSYSHNPILNYTFDLKVFICTSNEKQQLRILKRSNQEKLDAFNKFWIPKENAYFEKFKIMKNSDLVIES